MHAWERAVLTFLHVLGKGVFFSLVELRDVLHILVSGTFVLYQILVSKVLKLTVILCCVRVLARRRLHSLRRRQVRGFSEIGPKAGQGSYASRRG